MSNYIYSEKQYANALAHAKKGYAKGIAYYKTQQAKFMLLMKNAEKESLEKRYTDFAIKMNNELSQISMEDILTSENLEKFKQQIQQLAKNIIDADTTNTVQTIVKSSPGRTNSDNPHYLRNYSQRIKDALNAQVLTESYRRQVLDIYSNIFRQGRTINDSATINALYGFLRRQLIAETLNNQSNNQQLVNNLSGYTNVFRGDFREDIATKAFNQFQEGLAQRAGGLPGKNNVQSSIDIVVGPNAAKLTNNELEKIVKQLDALNYSNSLNIELLPEQNFFSAQVKSWSVPNASTPIADREYRSIGNRADIYNEYGFGIGGQNDIDFKRGWHNSASVLGKNITRALGKSNIFYIAQDKFYWTADLIQTFKNANYYLTFYYKRKTSTDRSYEFTYPATTDVVWQKQMYKNLHKLKRKR